jgi:tetratricopeptide (TPR) repeat protein
MMNDSSKPIEFQESPFAGDEDANAEHDLQEAEKYLRLHPEDIDALINKGIAQGRLKMFEAAKSTLLKAKQLSLKTKNPWGLSHASMASFNLASFLGEMGLASDSEREYLEAIDFGTNSKTPGGRIFGALAANDLSNDYKSANRLPDALKLLSLAIELGKAANKPDGYFVAARASFKKGYMKLGEGAIEEYQSLFRDAIKFGRSAGIPRALRTATQAALSLARWYDIIGQEKQSKEFLEEAQHIGSVTNTSDTNFQASYASELLADNLLHSGRLREAQLAYRKAVDLGRSNGQKRGLDIACHASLSLGMLLDRVKSFSEAQSAYLNAISIAKEAKTANSLFYGATAAILLGTGFDELKQTREAIDMFEEAARLGEASQTSKGTDIANQARNYLQRYQS